MGRLSRRPAGFSPARTALEVARQAYRLDGPLAESFRPQREAAVSRQPREIWQCSRRAGKTATIPLLIHEDTKEPHDQRYEYVYCAKTRDSAKGIVWRDLKRFSDRYGLQWAFWDYTLHVELPSGDTLEIRGADQPDWMDRLHGRKLRGVFLDEAPFWRHDLRYFIDEVLDPALADLRGLVRMMSRPGDACSGYFHDACHGIVPGWQLRKWSWRDNPYVAEALEEHYARRKADHPGIEDTPGWRRNVENEWVSSSGARVYAYEHEPNSLPEWKAEPGTRYALGVDFGWHDPTAFALLAFQPSDGTVVVVDTYAEEHLFLEQIAARIRMYMDAYPGVIIYGDPARTQVVQELQMRHGLPVREAEKTSKRDWIGTVNGDFVDQRLMIFKGPEQPIAEELLTLSWETLRSGRIVERPGDRNDMADAMLYAYRSLFVLTRRSAEAAPDRRTAEEMRKDDLQREIQDELAAVRKEQNKWHHW
jgi:hypothetical protein